MKKYESKEKLLQELKNINHNYFYEVCGGEADGDLIGKDTFMYVNAMHSMGFILMYRVDYYIRV